MRTPDISRSCFGHEEVEALQEQVIRLGVELHVGVFTSPLREVDGNRLKRRLLSWRNKNGK